jgi:hypothetical protein
MIQYTKSWDLSSIPDDLLQREAAKRRRSKQPAALRKRIELPCKGCGKLLSARERYRPCPACGARNRYQGSQAEETMQHRHLKVVDFSAMSLDDMIERGKWQDWAVLRVAARRNPEIARTIRMVCAARGQNPYAQRHRFWGHYAEKLLQAA